jgi:hypothetical protein
MYPRLFLLAALFAAGAVAQPTCPPTPAYSRCELVFELNDAERAAHPNPYLTLNLQIEFRSPRHRTQLMPAFWDGGGRMVVRFAPTDVGEWAYRVTSNIDRFDSKEGKFTATESGYAGFVIPANGHHWRFTEGQAAHLWMGDTLYPAAFIDEALFQKIVDTRAAQKFNHIRCYAVGKTGYFSGPTFRDPDTPDPAFYKTLDARMAYMNNKGITVDMILGHDQNFLADAFPMAAQRERYLRYLIARYSAFNITWEITQEFEEYDQGREVLKQMGFYLKSNDPYQHPRSTHTVATSAPLLGDGWMDHVLYQTSDDQLGAIEHQIYAVPGINSEFAYENSGAGATHPHHVGSDEFRHRLWNAFMDGQYPTFGNTGTYGSPKLGIDAKYLDSPGAKAMTAWYDLIATTRHWELEPYFDLDGGRAMALPDTEYIVYVEKPSGPIEVRLEKHEYDVKWVDPATGEIVPQKQFKSDKFTGEPPNREHDWVLHISREGRKEGMLKSWKFESRPFMIQEPESAPTKVPFEIAEPKAEEVSLSKPPKYAVGLKRETRGTRSMMYLWTGDVPVDGEGYRVLGTGAEGTWRMWKNVARTFPGVMNVRLYGMNANGKVYFIDKIYRVTP